MYRILLIVSVCICVSFLTPIYSSIAANYCVSLTTTQEAELKYEVEQRNLRQSGLVDDFGNLVVLTLTEEQVLLQFIDAQLVRVRERGNVFLLELFPLLKQLDLSTQQSIINASAASDVLKVQLLLRLQGN